MRMLEINFSAQLQEPRKTIMSWFVLRQSPQVPVVPGFCRANERSRISQWPKESSGIAIFGLLMTKGRNLPA